MKNWQELLIALVGIIAALLILITLRGQEDTWIKDKNGNWVVHGNPSIVDFETCAKKYPIIETFPEQCTIPNGPSFTKQY